MLTRWNKADYLRSSPFHGLTSSTLARNKRELTGKKLTTECSSTFGLEAQQLPEMLTAPFKKEHSDPPGLGEDVMRGICARLPQVLHAPAPETGDSPAGQRAAAPVRAH